MNADTGNLQVVEVDHQLLSGPVQEWFERVGRENGIYLYQETENSLYVYLNSYNVIQGEAASYFDDVRADIIDNQLLIFFSVKTTLNYQDSNLENNCLLLKVTHNEETDVIRLIEDGEDTTFKEITVDR